MEVYANQNRMAITDNEVVELQQEVVKPKQRKKVSN